MSSSLTDKKSIKIILGNKVQNTYKIKDGELNRLTEIKNNSSNTQIEVLDKY